MGSKPILLFDLLLDMQFPSLMRKAIVISIPHTLVAQLTTTRSILTLVRIAIVNIMLANSVLALVALVLMLIFASVAFTLPPPTTIFIPLIL